MNVKIYQTLFSPEQYSKLDDGVIPYDNLKNENPEYREYPLIVDLYTRNRTYDGYWGLISLKFEKKTNIKPITFKQMILNNPGYDVYHFNPCYHMVLEPTVKNPFQFGDIHHHKGICDYINKLMFHLGYTNYDVANDEFDPEQYTYCSYYVGNQNFWERWITFSQICFNLSVKNPDLNYLFESTSIHDYNENLLNFPFVMERLVGLFMRIHKNNLLVKMFH